MAHPEYIRLKAIQMREDRKLTIDEIADRLAINRTTVYSWVKDISIPREPNVGFQTEAQKRGTLAMQEKFRKIRTNSYAEGAAQFEQLILEPTFRDFVCMYIGEGYKRQRNTVSLCNSDPAVVKLAQTWITRFSQNPVTYSIQYHVDQSLDELREFWSNYLGISPDEIRFQRKSNSNQLRKRTWRSRHGVLSVSASDTKFRAQLQAWIDLVEDDWK